MEIITSAQNKRIKELVKLKQKKYRDQEKLFLIETKHLVAEALKHGQLRLIITCETTYENGAVEILYVSKEIMQKLTNFKQAANIMGVCAYFNREIDYSADIVVLAEVQDPGNLGNIMRTCLAFGINNLVLSAHNVDCYNPKVVQASQGALFQLNIIKEDLWPYLSFLKAKNYYLLGTSLSNATSLYERKKIKGKKAFFFGNEGQGLKAELIRAMDVNYYIPIANIDSLNVGNALAIMLYEYKKD